MTIWTDTNFAGCGRTRKSTRGGVAMLGSHMVKSWCSTQSIVSLSSGEAEYYGIVKGASMGLGIRSMMRDFGVELGVAILTDASAAQGVPIARAWEKFDTLMSISCGFRTESQEAI